MEKNDLIHSFGGAYYHYYPIFLSKLTNMENFEVYGKKKRARYARARTALASTDQANAQATPCKQKKASTGMRLSELLHAGCKTMMQAPRHHRHRCRRLTANAAICTHGLSTESESATANSKRIDPTVPTPAWSVYLAGDTLADKKKLKNSALVEKPLHIHRRKCAKSAVLQHRTFLSNFAPASIQCFSRTCAHT